MTLIKQLLTTILLFSAVFSPSYSVAIEIKASLGENAQKELEKQDVIVCDASESSICEQVCGQSSVCVRPEHLCQDCVGLKNQSLRTAFTDLPFLYRRSTDFISQSMLVNFLKEANYMLIAADSYLNIFNPDKKDLIEAQFKSFCPDKPVDRNQSALLIASFDEKSQIQQFVGVLCTSRKRSTVYALKYNPEYSQETINYWQHALVNTDAASTGPDSLVHWRLKISTELVVRNVIETSEVGYQDFAPAITPSFLQRRCFVPIDLGEMYSKVEVLETKPASTASTLISFQIKTYVCVQESHKIQWKRIAYPQATLSMPEIILADLSGRVLNTKTAIRNYNVYDMHFIKDDFETLKMELSNTQLSGGLNLSLRTVRSSDNKEEYLLKNRRLNCSNKSCEFY